MIARLSELSKREFTLLTFILLVLAGYLSFTLAVEPQLIRFDATRAKVDASRRLLQIKRLSASTTSTGRIRLEKLHGEIGALDARYFTFEEATEFLAGLSSLVESAGCQFMKVDFLSEDKLARFDPHGAAAKEEGDDEVEAEEPDGTDEGKTVCSMIRVRVFFRGKYAAIDDLLHALAEHPGKVRTGRLRFEIVDEDSSDLDGSIVITVFSIEHGEGKSE